MKELLPWLQPQWQRLQTQFVSGRLPHALLVAGAEDSGKHNFTEALVAMLLCQGPDRESAPCGQCNQCHLLKAGTHADFLEVTLEDSKQIKVDQIRDLIDWANQTAQQGGWKVCVINPAHRLNLAAANALLKCLEEPPRDTVLCLVSDQPTRLLPTIRSRCQRIECHVPNREEALAWLQQQGDLPADPELMLEIAGGVPLRAVNRIDESYLELRQQLAENLVPLGQGATSPIQVAANLARTDPELVLEILYQLIADTISYSLSGDTIRNTDIEADIRQYAAIVSLPQRYGTLDRISSARGSLAGTSNANAQMLLEWVLVDY